ncbi:MAG: DUF167 domain-containing protein [Spirochaetaceae bacterium]|jgi:uncharacterized protein (TIGR00251 family)|nr:DUF167 domain-containing protein [Spirochaetaceae bacterium]
MADPAESCFRLSGNTLLLDVKVFPGASRSEIMRCNAGRLRIAVAAPPEDGKANVELCRFMAKLLGCPRKAVRLCSGEKSRLKTLGLPLEVKKTLEALTIYPEDLPTVKA